jgi:hypothetical protein
MYLNDLELISKAQNNKLLVCGAEIKCVLQHKKTGTISLEIEDASSFSIDEKEYTVLWADYSKEQGKLF